MRIAGEFLVANPNPEVRAFIGEAVARVVTVGIRRRAVGRRIIRGIVGAIRSWVTPPAPVAPVIPVIATVMTVTVVVPVPAVMIVCSGCGRRQ